MAAVSVSALAHAGMAAGDGTHGWVIRASIAAGTILFMPAAGMATSMVDTGTGIIVVTKAVTTVAVMVTMRDQVMAHVQASATG